MKRPLSLHIVNGVLIFTPDNGSFTFTNEYRFKGEDAAKVDLSASRVMRLPEGVEYTMADDEFTFTLTPQEGNSKYDPVSDTTITSGVASDNKADFSVLSNVVYERPGTYFYVLKEVDDGRAGISYDASAYTIKVDVKINDESKKLEALVSIDKGGEAVNDIVFENVFNPNEITLDLVGTKTLLFEGNYKDFDAGAFSFLINDGETQKEVSNTASSGGKAEIALGSYTYTRNDIGKEYHYTVKELADDSNKNYTYDTREYEVTVKVDVAQTSGINDVLTLDVSYLVDGEATDQIEFINHYMPEATSFDLTGIKELLVNEAKIELEKGAFSFELFDDNNDLIKTATNDENGNFTFQDIAITSSETHFRVSEKIGNDPNVTYDQNTYDVNVKAKDENGTWVIEKVELSLASKEVGDLKFVNKYDPKALSLSLEGLKELSGRALKDSEFLFEVRDDQGQLVATSRNDADGRIVFELDSLSPDKTYQIKEIASSDPQITYDDKVYELVIKADFDGSKLSATYELKLDGKAIDDIVFNNTYTKPPVSEVEDDPITGEGEIQIPNTSVR